MARGESPKDRPTSIGMALVGVVFVAALCSLFGVVASLRPAVAPPVYTPPAAVEPFTGAMSAFGVLGSRDASRATLLGGATLPRDPARARTSMEATLSARGYVVGASAETAPAPMPFEITAADLDGSCGVVSFVGDVGATITAAAVVGGTSYASVDPSAFTVAVCGATPVRVEGTGSASARAWLFPGLTPSSLAASGLSADALLAHAEAEVLLRRIGYAPVDEVVVSTWTGPAALGAPHRPTAGCTPFVAYVEGAGRAMNTLGGHDYLADRALAAVVGCGVRAWDLSLTDSGASGATVTYRAYAAAPPSTTVTAGAIRTVTAASATWPLPLAEL